jgi:hypothetical protein
VRDARLEAGADERDVQPLGRHLVALSMWQAGDQAVQAQAAQVVGHLAWADLTGLPVQELRQAGAQVFVGETGGSKTAQDERGEERLHTGLEDG